MSISIGGYLLFIYLFIYLFHFCFLVTHCSFADFIGDNIVLLPTYNSSADKLFDKPFVVVVAVALAPTFTKLERKRFGAIAKYMALNVLLEKLPPQQWYFSLI